MSAGKLCQTCLPQTNPDDGSSAAQVDVVVVDPKNAATIYAAVNGAGLFKSGDGGRTWTASNTGLPNTDVQTGRTTNRITAVVIDPSATGVLYLGGSGGVFRSGDGAGTWQPRNNALTSSRIGALAIDPTDGKKVYAGSASESGDAFLARLRQPVTGAPALDYFTFLGGGDAANGLAVTPAGEALVAGQTTSINFPVTASALQKAQAGRGDAFLVSLDPRRTGAESLRYFVSASGSGWTCSRAAEVVTCLNRNPLAAGATATLSLDLRIARTPAGGQLTNTASVYSLTSDPKPENNTASLKAASIAPPCPFTITPSSLSFSDAAGNGSVAVRTEGGCGWTATTESSFITLVETGGTGPGELRFTVAANLTRNTRTGSIIVAGLRVTIIQSGVSCDPRLTPSAQSFDAAGGSGSVEVALPGECEWTAVSDNPAILTVTAGATGKGSGRVEFSVAPNEQLADRIGILTISGRQFPVTQQGVVCSYAISPQRQTFGFDGGSGEITDTAPKPCAWLVANANPNFIMVKPEGLINLEGTGNGVVKFEVMKNEIALRRTGRVLIAGLEFTITQDAFGCSFTLDPAASRSFDAKGGDGTALVTASQDVCPWSVTGADFVEVLSDQDQTGTAHVLFRVEPNRTAASRKTSILIAGRELEINQTAPSSRLAACTYALTLPPAGQTFGVAGGSASILITASQGCDWRATVDNASMISFEGNDRGLATG